MLSVMWSGSEEENRSNDWKEKTYYIIYLKLVQKVTKTMSCSLFWVLSVAVCTLQKRIAHDFCVIIFTL